MLQKEKHKIECYKYIENVEELNDICKISLKDWVDHCYKLNKPQTKSDIDNIITKAFSTDSDVNKLIPAVLKKAMDKGYYNNLFLDWKVSYEL